MAYTYSPPSSLVNITENIELPASKNVIAAGLVNTETRKIIEVMNFVCLSGIMSIVGMVTNAISMIIFVKQGLNSTMNISFFALAVSDFCSGVCMEWIGICVNPLFENSDIPWDTPQIQYLTGAWPFLFFGRTTCWITTFVTAERCLCIALPLKVKQIVTPNRTRIIISVIFIVNILSMVSEYSSAYFDWVYFPDRNRTLITLVVRANREIMEPIGFVLFATLGTASFPAVIMFTAILVVKLREQAKWRKASSQDKQTQLTSKRDIKAMNMVVAIAGVLIACYTPGVLASLITFMVPSFNIVGKDVNLYFSVWSFVGLFQVINSSINIFFYYKMSTKYKKTFHEIFGWCGKSDVTTKIMRIDGER